MQLFFYSALHLLEDGLCAYWMLSRFCGDRAALCVLLYNFCAFALQLPFGILLDSFQNRTCSPRPAFLTATAGLLLTALGFFSPVVCGIGNAMFHVGGGVAVIREDNGHRHKGADLGCFVAPGAIGLYLGAKAVGLSTGLVPVLWSASVGLICLCQLRFIRKGSAELPPLPQQQGKLSVPELFALLSCFLVVILRSYVGSELTLPWKSGTLAGAAVLAVAGGKLLGGLLAKRFGAVPATIASLLPAAVLFYFSDWAVCGILALLLFNMTMPLTLQAPSFRLPQHGGFCFGLLTFGLFLGWLPAGLKLSMPESNAQIGTIGSLLSLLLLVPALLCLRRNAE